jgi:hypothetical protein
MSKYDPLAHFLKGARKASVTLAMSEIEDILGENLPQSARRYPAWWSNNEKSHVQAAAWLHAGYKTRDVDIAAGKLTFVAMRPPTASVKPKQSDGRPPRAALFGCMKGTTIVMPGVDLTAPTAPEWGRLDD